MRVLNCGRKPVHLVERQPKKAQGDGANATQKQMQISSFDWKSSICEVAVLN